MASISVKPHSALVAPKPGHHHPQNVPQYSASLQNNESNSSTDQKPSTSAQEKELEVLTSKLLLNMQQASTEPEFTGVCSRCQNIIKRSEDGCTAMDRFYHSACFTCESCNRQLTGHSFYAVEEKVLCEGCHVNTLEKCQECWLPVTERILRATGKVYHPECFTCCHCNKSLDGIPFTVDSHNKIHCVKDFHMKYAPRCSVCKQPILPDGNGVETVRVVALDRNFHVSCYKCENCGVVMSTEVADNGCFPIDGHLYCRRCHSVKQQSSVTSDGSSSPLAITDM